MFIPNNGIAFKTNALNEALAIKRSIYFSISNECGYVNSVFKHKLNKPQHGIYLKNTNSPIMDKDKIYYSYPGGNPFTVMDVITDDIESIRNECGIVIINKYLINNRDKLLTVDPLISNPIENIIINLIYKLIYELNPKKELLIGDQFKVSDHVKWVAPIVANLDEEELINLECDEDNLLDVNEIMFIIRHFRHILESIEAFVSNSPTSIYIVEINNGSLMIGETMDIRAFRYQMLVEYDAMKQDVDF